MKKYINQVLGDSLRCILPSYWWKRLLGKMADKIESAEKAASSANRTALLIASEFSSKQDTLYSGSNIKTINGKSVLGSGNLSISTEKIEKYSTIDELKANGSTAGGDLAAVVDATLVEKSFSECYQPTSSEISNSKYDVKYTKIDGITVNPDFSPSLILENYGQLSIVLYSDGESKGYHKTYPSSLEIRCDYSRYIYCYEYDGTSGTGHRLYDTSQGISNTAIERVNKILREGNFRFSYFEVTYKADINDSGYRYYYSYDSDFPSSAKAMIDSFVKMIYAEPQNADIYVRSKEWEKLTKELIVASKDELDALEAPKGSIAKIVKGGFTQVKASDLFLSYDTEINWDKYTIIKSIERKREGYATSIGQLILYDSEVVITVLCNATTTYALLEKDGVETQLNGTELNQLLSQKEFRCINGSYLSIVDEYYNLYTLTPLITDAYIKGETWTRFLKEGDAVGGGTEILELTIGETEEDRAKNVEIYNKIVEAFNSDTLNIPMISIAGMLVSNVVLSGIEGDLKAHMNLVLDYVAFKYFTTLNLAKTGEVTFEEELEYSDYYYITNSSGMVKFCKCVLAGLLPTVLYTDPKQGLVIADTFNGEGDNIVLYFNLSKGRTKVVVSPETGEILSEEVVSTASGSTFVIDLTVEEIEDAISNNNGVIDYTLNRELIIDALSKNIPMVVRIGEHSEGYCLTQGELDGTDTLTITFSHSQYKYSLLIGDNDIEVDRRNVESFVTSTPLRIWYSDELTPAQKEDNVKAYNALMNKEAFDFELLYIDEGEDYYSINKEVVTGFTCHLDSQKVHISILVAATDNGLMTEPLYLTSDGTFEFEAPPL